jgi:hypothetical protein
MANRIGHPIHTEEVGRPITTAHWFIVLTGNKVLLFVLGECNVEV